MANAITPQRYIGTKVINAFPMTRAEYNNLRGWTVPEDENPEDEGYLVEYTDGGKANVPGFAGYVSWSPADVFNRAYRLSIPPVDGLRELHDHKVNPANDTLTITVEDAPGAGGAHHQYRIRGEKVDATIEFQNGPIAHAGVNGLTHEALLAIVCDRLRSFQAGPYACRENAVALTKLEEAQMWLQKRTRDRMARGVEGTHTI